MKNTTILIFCVLAMQNAFGQSHPANTQQNGVVIVESKGVETANQSVFKSNPARTIADWTLPECEDALRSIALKLAAVPKGDENYDRVISYYKEEQEKIQQRKQQLTRP